MSALVQGTGDHLSNNEQFTVSQVLAAITSGCER
jgi:hypothetical protein